MRATSKTLLWQTNVKSNDAYKPIREGLKPALKSLAFSRVKSSPPSYSRPGGNGHICLWFKVSSAGWDYALGGKLTGALQSATEPLPGIEWIDGDFASKRIWRLLDDVGRRAAIEVHNSIITSFSPPPADHWIYTMQQEIVDSGLADLEPLTEIPSADHDFWFRYLNTDHVAQWTTFFGDTLSQIIDSFESTLT